MTSGASTGPESGAAAGTPGAVLCVPGGTCAETDEDAIHVLPNSYMQTSSLTGKGRGVQTKIVFFTTGSAGKLVSNLLEDPNLLLLVLELLPRIPFKHLVIYAQILLVFRRKSQQFAVFLERRIWRFRVLGISFAY